MKHFKFSTCWKAMKKAAVDFNNDNGFKLAASLSYSMIFSIAPFVIVAISLAGIIWGEQAARGRIYHQIKDLVGVNPAQQIQDIIRNIQGSHHTMAGAIIGGVILIIGATGVFTEIQGSINYMWCILAKPKKGWLKFLMNRLLSFSLIVAFGFISMVSLVVNSLMDLLGDFLKQYFTHFTVYLFYAVNLVLALGAILLLFMIIFRILPDAIISWRDSFVGALFTAVLFMVGKLLIGLYLGNSRIGIIYGAAASIIIILTWVYYSSIILYYGAEFTKAYAEFSGRSVRPNSTAVYILKKEAKELS
ncbi:MAG TPA: YihY/virulence factor BrkB family protein [Puia sp.]|nr:YihY/virulence factor BrkB family protein [Puia sp.]